jgi:Domain of unknown function (DUF4390)
MRKRVLALSTSFLFLLSSQLFGVEIVGPEVRVGHDEIVVDTGLSLDEKILSELKSGLGKEITFYIDLFKVWKGWPDEFMLGKKFVQTLKGDSIKGEYVATSFDGETYIKKRFMSFASMLSWTLNKKDIRLVNHIRELEPSDYFVKVTVESRLRKLPPVIGYLLFFVPEKDFTVSKNSPAFTIEGEK